MDHLFCGQSRIWQLFQENLLYTPLSDVYMYIFSLYEYTSHLPAHILYIYTNPYSPHSDRSTLDKWPKVNINDIKCYVIIISVRHFLSFYKWQGEETMCFMLSLYFMSVTSTLEKLIRWQKAFYFIRHWTFFLFVYPRED
jgi:hypothetical protein